MKVLFIDDRKCEIERLVALSQIDRFHNVGIYIFKNFEDCIRATRQFDADVIFIGHGLSTYPITGADVIKFLRDEGFQSKMIGNSGGGRYQFDADGANIDDSADRNPGRIAEICTV